MLHIILYLTFSMVVVLFILILFILLGWRFILKQIVKRAGKIILTDSYQENILELIPGLKNMGIQTTLENSLRAETGDLLHRPLGSTKNWPHFDPITFIPAQTKPFPTDQDIDIDISVTIGPKAKKPMKLKIPLMISGMAYGIALSEEVRIALSLAANNAGTAINSGEGGILPEELDYAGKYILQFSKTKWAKEEKLFKRADMIEVKLGQGAFFGIGSRISPENLTGNAREVMGLEENVTAEIFDNFFERQTLKDLKELIADLREFTNGIPIGVKIGAGGKIEEDIDHLLQLEVDYIAIDGAQAATLGAAPILADDMGIPTLHAIVRAVKHLEKRNMRDSVSLIVSGGLFIPGHFLKVLALGADAIYLGSAMLFSVSHTHSLNPLPFEPPTQAIWNEGKFKNQFKIEEGTRSAENFLISSVEEMKTALRAMGKHSLSDLSKKDLVSYDESTAKSIGIPFSFEPWDDKQQSK